MNAENKFYKKSIIFAIVLYVVVFIILFGSLNNKNNIRTITSANHSAKIMHAVTVNRAQVQRQIRKIKSQQRAKHRAEIAKQKHLAKLAAQAKQLQQQNSIAKQKLLQMKKQQQQAQQHLAKLKQQHQQAIINKRNLIARDKIEKQLQAQIAAEQKQIDTAQTQQERDAIDKYKALIINVIEQNWIVPQKVDKNLSAQLVIDLAPGGTVLHVKILQSSGNPVLDRSVITAVWKASPLPVPNDLQIFNRMRELHLTVKPEGYL